MLAAPTAADLFAKTEREARADDSQRALAEKIGRDGTTSPDELRDLLSRPGFSQAARRRLAGNVDAAAALRRELVERYGQTDWRVPKLNEQGAISVTGPWGRVHEAELASLNEAADRYGAPIVVRGEHRRSRAVHRRQAGYGCDTARRRRYFKRGHR